MSDGRVDRLAGLVAERELDLLLVGDLVSPGDSGPDAIANLRWLTGFSGTSGLAVVGPQERVFLTDFRYTARAAREVSSDFECATVDRNLIVDAAKRLRGRVGYDDAHTSVKNLRRLEEETENAELVAAGGLVEKLRRRKDSWEIEMIAKAARVADAALEAVFEQGVVGRTEREIMLDLHHRMRELGADDPSFPAIVAAGESSALPHHDSSDRKVRAGELLLIDFGAKAGGYCSDGTRTVATGEVDGEVADVYELVRAAQEKGLEAVRAGISGRDADDAARQPIAAAGYAERFGHGLGHGVGLEVHEAPRLSQKSDQMLEPGDVVTVEPGVYIPERFGVRIEDLVAVTEDGCRNFSGVPKELQVVG